MSTIGTLPVWRTISVSWRLPFVHWRALVRMFWFPVVLLLTVDYLWWAAYTPVFEISPPRSVELDGHGFELGGVEYVPTPWALLAALELLHAAILVPGMVAWHQYLMMGRTAHTPLQWFAMSPGRREIRYIAYGILLLAIMAVAHVLLQLVGAFLPDPRSSGWAAFLRVGLSYLFVPVATYPVLRLAFVLPDTATDRATSPDHSLRATHGNGLRLVLAFAGTALLPGCAYVALRFNLWVVPAEGPHRSLILDPTAAFIQVFFAIMAVTCLSVTARALLAASRSDEAIPDGARSTAIPVPATIYDSFAFPLMKWRAVLRFAWFPTIYASAVSVALAHLPSLHEPSPLIAPLIWLATTAAYFPAVAMAAVPVHRLVLQQECRDPVPLVFRIGRREWRYILRLAVLNAMLAVAMGFVILVVRVNPVLGPLLGWPAALTALVLFALLAISLPAISVDRDASLKGAFMLTRTCRISFIVVTFAALVPGLVVSLLAGEIGKAILTDSILWHIIAAAGTVIETAVLATALSLCYLHMGGMDNGGAAAQSPAP